MMTTRWLTPILLLLTAGAIPAQEARPLTSVALFKVAPDKVADFVAKGKSFVPVLDKLMDSGVVTAYGIDVDMLHDPAATNVSFWLDTPNFAGLSQAGKAIDDFEKTNPTVLADLRGLTDPAAHRDLIVQALESKQKSPPTGAVPVLDFDIVNVKQGQMPGFMTLFRKYDKPVLEKLVDDGTIYGYFVMTEAVHTMKPGTVWQITMLPDLGAKDKVRAAFHEAYGKVPKEEADLAEKTFYELIEPGSHRDELATCVLFKSK